MIDELFEINLRNFDKELESYLIKNGVEDINLSRKETFKKLKKIVETSKVDLDCTELRYTKNPGLMTAEEYVKEIHNIQINITEGNYFIGGMIDLVKIEKQRIRMENRKKRLEKIKAKLMPKKNS